MKRLLLVIFCLSTFFVHNTVLRPDIMEVRNLVTAHEMVVDGHWLVPTMNGEYRLEKPPLPTWVAACVELVFGDNLAIQRAMAGVMGLLLTLFLYLFALRLTGRRDTSLVAALMLMTCYTIILQGRTVTWDIYCHAFMMGAVWLDGGLDAALTVFKRLDLPIMEKLNEWAANPKGYLQVRAQALKPPSRPVYEVLKVEGPPHSPTVTARVTVEGLGVAEATAGSKTGAEIAAATALLARLDAATGA